MSGGSLLHRHAPARSMLQGVAWPNALRGGAGIGRQARGRAPGRVLGSRRGRLLVAAAAVGIDLGTSNSGVAVIKDGKPQMVTLPNGRSTLPSVVWYGGAGQLEVGDSAAARSVSDPENTFHSVKRVIGRNYVDVEEEAAGLAYGVEPDANGRATLRCPAAASALPPEDVSAEVLRTLLAAAAEEVGEAVDSAVVCVPAHFGNEQKCATIEAAAAAGLARVSLLQEPIAAAMAYGLGRTYDNDTFLVFDLGGGTYDVSVLEDFEGIMEVLAFDGDSRLGGNDIDAAIVELLKSHAGDGNGNGASPSEAAALRRAAEAAKIALSDSLEANVALADGRHLALSRADLEDAIAPLEARLWPPLKAVGKDAWVTWRGCPDRIDDPELKAPPPKSDDPYAPRPRHITQLVLVGGSTRVPAVRAFAEALTSVRASEGVDPEEAVALGAAVQAGLMVGELKSGIEIMDGGYVWDLQKRVSGFQV